MILKVDNVELETVQTDICDGYERKTYTVEQTGPVVLIFQDKPQNEVSMSDCKEMKRGGTK